MAVLERLHRVKQAPAPLMPVFGEELIAFFKKSVSNRQTKLATLSECWCRLVPQTLCDHCSLESFSRGSLTVLVDSAAHLYDLRQLLLAGLEKQIMLAAGSTGLRRITLRLGRWYDGQSSADRKIKF
jgi:hypothetical protein